MKKIFTILAIISTAGLTVLSELFGTFDEIFISLLFLMALDMASGLIKAVKNKNLNSEKTFIGIAKKIFILLLIAVSVRIDAICTAKGLNIDIVRDMVIMFYIINETISIIENAGEVIPIPDKLKDILQQLKDKGEKKWLKN